MGSEHRRMNPLLQFAIRKMDGRCRAWEARSEAGHRIPDGVREYLDVPFQGAGGVPLAVDIFRDAVNQMVDHSCSEETENAFRETALAQPGVMGVELLRTRMFGNRVYVDLEIAADPALTLAAAHEIAETVHDAIEQAYPDVKHIMVHVNPARGQEKR